MRDIVREIADGISNLEDSDNVSRLVRQALRKKIPVAEILEEGLRKGLAEVGRKYEAGEWFLSELLYGASLSEEAMKIIAPRLETQRLKKKGIIVLGTVKGDIHDIGKNIFRMIAEASGFEVQDLGVDVPPERFIETVAKKRPDVLALSALLTTTISEMRVVVDQLKVAGLRDQVKILLGGNAVTEDFRKEIGADAAALDAVQGINFCKVWMAG